MRLVREWSGGAGDVFTDGPRQKIAIVFSLPAEELLQRRLELVVLERVHERINAAVDEDGDDSEMVQVAVEVDREAEIVHGEVDLVGRPTGDEAYAHHRQDLDDIAARFGGAFTAHGCSRGDVVLYTQDGGDSAVTAPAG